MNFNLRILTNVFEFRGRLALFLMLTITASGAFAETATSGKSVKLIELFTSHGCSSCPRADKFLGELLENDPELLALEYHVDYWNTLVHGSAGNFVDPFSSAEYTLRQREYNAAKLYGQPGVYTPQAVINGQYAAVGSDQHHITKALNKKQTAAFEISQESNASDASILQVTVSGDQQLRQALAGTDITLVRYIDSASTTITGGENQNLELVNHHIVFEVTQLGQISDDEDMVYTIGAPIEGEGCVVLVQEGAFSPVYAALECS